MSSEESEDLNTLIANLLNKIKKLESKNFYRLGFSDPIIIILQKMLDGRWIGLRH